MQAIPFDYVYLFLKSSKYCKIVSCSGRGFMFCIVIAIGSLLLKVQQRKLTLFSNELICCTGK